MITDNLINSVVFFIMKMSSHNIHGHEKQNKTVGKIIFPDTKIIIKIYCFQLISYIITSLKSNFFF